MTIRRSVGAIVLSASALAGIALDEGYRSDAYAPVKGDKPTIGFGETSGVKMGDRTTPERALVQLLVSAEKHADGVRQCVKVPLHQYEFDAYTSLAYNIGVGSFCRSTLVRKLNAGDYSGACSQILRWNKFHGKPLRGLTKRRRKEYQTCIGG